jgi:hypothetical protein
MREWPVLLCGANQHAFDIKQGVCCKFLLNINRQSCVKHHGVVPHRVHASLSGKDTLASMEITEM